MRSGVRFAKVTVEEGFGASMAAALSLHSLYWVRASHNRRRKAMPVQGAACPLRCACGALGLC